ncbi:MAG: hypothetical protein QXU32_01925 [Nitrososphaerales archaeon]
MLEVYSVSYANLKSEYNNKRLRLYYISRDVGYTVIAASAHYAIEALITDSNDISDFQNNYISKATSVGNVREAIGLSKYPNAPIQMMPTGSVGIPLSSGISFGYVSTSSTAVVPIRATAYTAPTNSAQRSIRSSSASDINGGTGARKVKITYYDSLLDGPYTEDIILNGTTWVNTTNTNIVFIEKMEVIEVGSNGSNAGTITLMSAADGGGSSIGSIAIGDNITHWAHHYVASGRTAYINSIVAGSTAIAGRVNINASNPIDATKSVRAPQVVLLHSTTTNAINLIEPIPITGPALVWLTERANGTTASATYAHFGWVET